MPGLIYTEDKLEYTFFPVKKYSITLTVKTDHDAHIALSSQEADSCPILEIFLGGWDNSKSAIRLNKEKPDIAVAETPGVLSADEARNFVLEWTTDGNIKVFVQNAAEPFLSCKNDSYFPINFFGLRTSWGANGEWNIDGAKQVETQDSQEYKWFPVHGARVDFEVKAKNDAHISFAGAPSDDTPVYEVFLGGWGNTKCALRFNKEKPDVSEADVDGAVNGDEFKKYWIAFSYAGVKVGRGGETEPFLSWTNPEPFVISHFGVRTSYNSDGYWRIDGVEGTVEEPETKPAEVEPEPDASNEVAPLEPSGDEERPKRDVPETEGIKWVAASAGEIPEGSLKGGEDNGNILFVARAEHEGAVIPGKLLAEHAVCYIPWGGEEHGKESYEVLVIAEDAVSWVVASGDTVPENAIRGGTSLEDEPLYIGRVNHEGAATIGKVHPSHACIYISYGGAEISYPEYEILVKN